MKAGLSNITFHGYRCTSVEKLIDTDGNEKFHSIYSGIDTWKKPYEVYIRDDKGTCHGLIDEYENIVLPLLPQPFFCAAVYIGLKSGRRREKPKPLFPPPAARFRNKTRNVALAPRYRFVILSGTAGGR